MGYRYAIIGTGRQGLSAAYDIGKHGNAEEIRLYDLSADTAAQGTERINRLLKKEVARGFPLDAGDRTQLEQSLKDIDATVSAVPFQLNPLISETAVACGSSVCDLGGHTETVRRQLKLHDTAKSRGVTVTPDCGMGPGLNISLGVYAMSFVEEPEEVLIYDAGLPANPQPPWNYQLTFNMNGLTNEYDGNALFLRNGEVTEVPCLGEIETLEFPPPLGRLEAAVTSGGLSTAPWTFQNRNLQRLENKTLRYPGHWARFKAYQQLGLFEEKPVTLNDQPIVPRDFYHTLLESKITGGTIRDICVIRVICRGRTRNKPASCTLDLTETYDEATGFTAMEKLTGWHAAMVAILSARGEIPRGAVPVESVLSADQIARESALRGWEIKNSTTC
ncbi:hypothetical protein UR09_00800 [Candidatus Nitromaritima sp. SCGC AAA799-A02]|nr:hypothetical protein UR09_00800 [Candidatus Nitromaritima sp. SCGC AAA799-A02]